VLVRNREDWRRCRPGGPIGMILALEGAHALIGDVGLLEALHGLGLRVLTLTWNHANPFGAGCAVAPDEDTGLTPLGHELLRRAQSLGILVDLAHASPRTLAATLASARGPCLVSHTACAALRAHRRNLSDAQLRAVAAAGGLIGIALYPPFLVEEGEATPATVALHVRHALEVAGPAAVAMGTDFDGITRWPVGLSGLQDLAGLAAALAEAGLDAATLEAVLWRNAARVLDQGLGD
jgi:membrane dipeptidase